MVILSKRLEMVASLVPEGCNCADIGADHGYLISYLVENNIVSKAYACENKIGPFSRLEENLRDYNLLDKIEIDLSDGISSLPSSYNTVIIAGMGGDTVVKILTDSLNKLVNIDYFIISSHTKMYEVRKFLIELGYYIEEEKCCFEEKQFYQVSKFSRGTKNYSELNLKYGPKLIENKDITLLKELERTHFNNNYIASLDFIPQRKKEQFYHKNKEIEQIIEMLK